MKFDPIGGLLGWGYFSFLSEATAVESHLLIINAIY